MATTKQKWLIGCSGCLVVIVGFFVIAGILGKMGIDKLNEGSQQTAQAIFGSALPEGYLNIGLPIKSDKGDTHMLLSMTPKKHMLIAFEGKDNGNHVHQLDLNNREELEENIEHFWRESASQSNNISADELRMDKTSVITLANGKQFPMATMTAKNDSGKYFPVVATLLPTPDNHYVLLMTTNPQTTSTVAETDFSASQQLMQHELTDLIEVTELDDMFESFN